MARSCTCAVFRTGFAQPYRVLSLLARRTGRHERPLVKFASKARLRLLNVRVSRRTHQRFASQPICQPACGNPSCKVIFPRITNIAVPRPGGHGVLRVVDRTEPKHFSFGLIDPHQDDVPHGPRRDYMDADSLRSSSSRLVDRTEPQHFSFGLIQSNPQHDDVPHRPVGAVTWPADRIQSSSLSINKPRRTPAFLIRFDGKAVPHVNMRKLRLVPRFAFPARAKSIP